MEGGQLVSELRLFDTFKSKLLIGKRYRGRLEDRREVVIYRSGLAVAAR